MSDIRRWMTLCEGGGRNLPSDIRPWLHGRCFDFALALSERLPNAEFICVGSEKYPEHVALRKDGVYYDARGKMDEHEFLTKFRNDDPYSADDLHPISRETVELNAGCAGMNPPYRGNKDVSEARRAVAIIFRKRT